MKFDFHCHSNVSDGLLSPQALVDYAIERQIELLALTDHDSINGLQPVEEYIRANALPLGFVRGVEISSLSDFGEIHIVGLNLDSTSPMLIKALQTQQEKRWQRAGKIDAQLIKMGVKGVLQAVENDVGEVVTRSHIARAIVQLGYAKDINQAFKRYIGKQGKVRVPKDWIPMAEAIELIKQAGGIAVLAHPTRYPLSNRKLSYLIEEFKAEGGEAIELAYPNLNKDKIEWLKIHRQKNDLMASSGSDFHYPNMRWTDLGRFPLVDSGIPHVLEKISSKIIPDC